MKKPHRESVRNVILLVVFAIVVAIFTYIIVLIKAPIRYSVSEGGFKVHCLYHDENLDFSDIDTLELATEYSSEKVKAFGGSSKQFGYYENRLYRTHYRLTYTENSYNFIIVTTVDNKVFVFNQKTVSATEKAYRKIADALVESRKNGGSGN